MPTHPLQNSVYNACWDAVNIFTLKFPWILVNVNTSVGAHNCPFPGQRIYLLKKLVNIDSEELRLILAL